MLKIKASIAALLGAMSLFLFSTPILAGGQLVSLHADSDGWVSSDSYGRVIRVYLHPEYPCKGTEVTFKFVDPKEGDYISTGSGGATYVMNEDRQPYYKNGVMGTTCSTYAKVSSKVFGERQFTVVVKNRNSVWSDPPVIKVHFDGKYHSDNAYDGQSYRSSTDDPYFSQTSKSPTPSVTPVIVAPTMIYPQDNQTLDLEGAYMFKVNQIYGASGYLFGLFQDDVMVYENYRDSKSLSSNGEFALWESNPAHAKFHAGEMKVMIRALVNNQWTDARTIFITLSPRGTVRVVSGPTVQPTFVPQPTPPTIPPSQIVVVTDSSASAALQQKVDELQRKLEQSQQRQSILEERLNQIINFIKSIFPFFR